jgi:uncharacterized protein YjiS (DUF1127 family)
MLIRCFITRTNERLSAMPALPHSRRGTYALRHLVPWLARFPARLAAAARLARSRKGLARLDAHLLRDIGLTSAEAQAEADRPVWDAPSHWKG